MRIKATLNNMVAYKQDFIEADLNFFHAQLKFDVAEAINKIKKSHDFKYRMVRLLRRASKFADITLESFLTNLEVMKNYKLFEYKIEHSEQEKVTKVELWLQDDYFEMVNMIKRANPLMQVGYSKEKFAKRVDKELRKTYDKNAEIEVIE